MKERHVNIGSALIANLEPSKAIHPAMRALDDPAVAPQALRRLHPAPGNPRRDAPFFFLTASRPISPRSL